MQRFRLAKLRDRVPMPERSAGVFFTDSKDGETIDPMNPFYARMIADGDLVAVEEGTSEELADKAPSSNSKPNGAK